MCVGFPPEFRVTVYIRKWSGNYFRKHSGFHLIRKYPGIPVYATNFWIIPFPKWNIFFFGKMETLVHAQSKVFCSSATDKSKISFRRDQTGRILNQKFYSTGCGRVASMWYQFSLSHWNQAHLYPASNWVSRLLFVGFIPSEASISLNSFGHLTREGGPCGHEPRNILFEHR